MVSRIKVLAGRNSRARANCHVLQGAKRRDHALGIDESGPKHGYMHVLAGRCGATGAFRVHPCGEDPGLILAAGAAGYTTSFFHGTNAIGVEADAPAGGPECERDRVMTYSVCRCVGTRGSFLRRRSLYCFRFTGML